MQRCHQQTHAGIVLVIAALAGPSSGCLGDAGNVELVEMDEASVLDAVAGYRDAVRFDPMNREAYASALGGDVFIQLYVSRTAAVPYAAIDPDSSGSGAVVPEGGVIVREVLDASGTAQRLTVMAKGPPGYNPTIGDWFWAVTDLDGVPVADEAGPRVGRLTDCYGCHVPRAGDDYLFGVPLSERGTAPPEQLPPQGNGDAVCGDFVCEGRETHDRCPKDCNHGHTHP